MVAGRGDEGLWGPGNVLFPPVKLRSPVSWMCSLDETPHSQLSAFPVQMLHLNKMCLEQKVLLEKVNSGGGAGGMWGKREVVAELAHQQEPDPVGTEKPGERR